LALSAAKPGFFPAFLESQSQSEKVGRYDILFAAPSVELIAYNDEQFEQLLVAIDTEPGQYTSNKHDCTSHIGSGPFHFGWVVYFSYESAYLLEPKLRCLLNHVSEPLAVAVYCQGAIVCDRISEKVTLYAKSQSVADEMEVCVNEMAPLKGNNTPISQITEASNEQFEQAVIQAKELIQTGDIYQANLSRQYCCTSKKTLTAAMVMTKLRAANPAPFAGLLQINDFALVSSSPERLFCIKGDTVETRPIAGTRPRGTSEAKDSALIEELINTPKERAEHIMLIDLGRNDLGRVCQIGTVTVDELMVVETYQHVHHIVSNIRGQLSPDVSFVDVLKALFPGGTITGCPKIRCMEIIRDIEQIDRGCYTGSMGYINHDGHADLNILIRTVAMQDNEITFNAGAGIVYDSNPTAELLETKHKAKGLIKALSEV